MRDTTPQVVMVVLYISEHLPHKMNSSRKRSSLKKSKRIFHVLAAVTTKHLQQIPSYERKLSERKKNRAREFYAKSECWEDSVNIVDHETFIIMNEKMFVMHIAYYSSDDFMKSMKTVIAHYITVAWALFCQDFSWLRDSFQILLKYFKTISRLCWYSKFVKIKQIIIVLLRYSQCYFSKNEFLKFSLLDCIHPICIILLYNQTFSLKTTTTTHTLVLANTNWWNFRVYLRSYSRALNDANLKILSQTNTFLLKSKIYSRSFDFWITDIKGWIKNKLRHSSPILPMKMKPSCGSTSIYSSNFREYIVFINFTYIFYFRFLEANVNNQSDSCDQLIHFYSMFII